MGLVCNHLGCRLIGDCHVMHSEMFCHNVSRFEVGPYVASRLVLIQKTLRFEHLSGFSESVQQSALEAGVDPKTAVCAVYNYGEAAAHLGYPDDANVPIYCADPRGNFPGVYLVLHLGRSSNRNIHNTQVRKTVTNFKRAYKESTNVKI